MKQRRFIVSGYKPAISQEYNNLIKHLDLGTEGLFVHFANEVTLTLEGNVTQEQLNKQPFVIKKAFEKLGCKNISIMETNNA